MYDRSYNFRDHNNPSILKTFFLVKFILILLVIAGILVLFINRIPKNDIVNMKYLNTISPTEDVIVTKAPNALQVEWLRVSDLSKVNLFSNLEGKDSSFDNMTKRNCESLVSGGFYTKDTNQIGLFISNHNKISEEIKSNFFDGFINIKDSKNVSISETSQPDFKTVLQSGPLLIVNNTVKKLQIKNDENARRIVGATTNNSNELIFIALYEKSNTLLGPKLENLGNIIKDLSNENNLNIINAINLDGGAHSAFVTKIIKLTEIATIGSYFCITP